MTHRIFRQITLALIALPDPSVLSQFAFADEPPVAERVAIRFVVLTDSHGSNAAASTKQIEQQVAVLRNDAARFGINVSVGGTQFVADSALRKVSPNEVTAFAARAVNDVRPNEIVVYVTGLTAPDKAPATKYLLLPRDGATTGERNDSQIPRGARNDSVVVRNDSGVGHTDSEALRDNSAAKADGVAMPVIVIDAKQFGGQGCGPTRAAPCRVLTLALADALSTSAQTESIRRSASEIRARTEQTIALEP